MSRNQLTAGLLAVLAVVSTLVEPVYGSGYNETHFLESGNPPCNALAAAGLEDRLLFPSDSRYEPQIETWWSVTCQLRPWCLFMPQSTEEVSIALSTLSNTGYGAGDWHLAIRSGGHSVGGINNIANGVTFDLSHLNQTTYDKETNTARLQPGARWKSVYATLHEQGVTAVGGRDGGVGVGGFLLGGGTSFFSPKLGYGCDSVVNYEVVLANGTVIHANKTANSDLWKALKGGSGNFGLVTRFDTEALPTRDIFYELRFLPGNYSDVVLDTLHAFTDHDESLADEALVTFFTHDPSISSTTSAAVIHANTEGKSDVKTSFSNVRTLPALINTTAMLNMAEAAEGSHIPDGFRDAISTHCFRNDRRILKYATEVHEDLIKSLSRKIGADNFTTMWFLQPMNENLGRIGEERGGNMLGLERIQSSAVMWTGLAQVNGTEADYAFAQSAMNIASAKIKEFSKKAGGEVDLVYMNYAHTSQNPLGSYGADRVKHIREVAEKYDPEGVFQNRFPGGFKISRVA
ncbi:hypothetical protein ACHAPJ_003898 [Fusarium lateritium]